MIKENLEEVREKIRQACQRSGRREEDVTLISVSKTKPVEMLREAYEAGSRDFGENRVQEIMEKYGQMPEDVRWHMIGHLQKNKVRQVIDKAVLIHSVDTVELAEQIGRASCRERGSYGGHSFRGKCGGGREQIRFPDRGSGGCCDENKRVSSRSHKRAYDNCSICIEFGR